MQISAFARLTEAREKALFLASELARAAERGERRPTGRETMLAPPTPPEVPPPPAPPSFDFAAEDALDLAEFRSAPVDTRIDAGKRPEPEPEPEFEPEPAPEAEPDAEPETRSVWLRNYYEDEGLSGGSIVLPDRRNTAPLQPASIVQRYHLARYGGWWLGGLLLVLAFCSLDRGDRDERFGDTPIDRAVQSSGFDADWEPALDVASQDALFSELFGPGVDASHVRQKAPVLWRLLLQGAESSSASQADGAREFLRTMIATSRRDVEFAQLVAIDRLYLSWLKQADEEGACREVTGLSFFDGVPHMAGADLDAERAVARQLLDSDELVWREPEGSGFEIPNPLLSRAHQRSGLSAERITGALASEAHPDRCLASIALLEAALDDPASVPRDLLAGI